jgi:hypothetical protein
VELVAEEMVADNITDHSMLQAELQIPAAAVVVVKVAAVQEVAAQEL